MASNIHGTITTNYRIIEPKPTGNFSTSRIGQNGKTTHLSCTSSSTSTIIEEFIPGTEISLIRIHQLNVEIPKTVLEVPYQRLQKLEVKCYFDTDTVFRMVAALKALKVLRFGATSFVGNTSGALPPQLCHTKIEASTTVQELVVSFDSEKFGSFQQNVRVEIEARIVKVLNYACQYLPGLKNTDLTLPPETDLDPFLASFPEIKAAGRKIEDYVNQTLAFKSGYFVRPTTSKNKRKVSSDSVSGAVVAATKRVSQSPQEEQVIYLSDDEQVEESTEN